MANNRPNPRRVKSKRSYTVEEAADLLCVHKNSVRRWTTQGLPVFNEMRPMIISGKELKTFLQARRAKNKRPCQPGEMYCVKCRAPKKPAGGMAEYQPKTDMLGNLVALCPDCFSIINQRASLAKMHLLLGKMDITFPQAMRHIGDAMDKYDTSERAANEQNVKAEADERKAEEAERDVQGAKERKETDKGVALFSRSRQMIGDSGIGDVTIKPANLVNKRIQSALESENAVQVSVTGGNVDALRSVASTFKKRIIFYREQVSEVVVNRPSDERARVQPVGSEQDIDARTDRGRADIPQSAGFITNGFVNTGLPDTIFLNADSSSHLLYILGHELGHTLRLDDPQLWAQMGKELQPLIRNWAAYKAESVSASANEFDNVEELFGDVIGQNFLNQDFWNDLANQNQSLFKKIANTAISILNKALKLIAGRDASRFISDMTQARAVIAKVMSQYANKVQQGAYKKYAGELDQEYINKRHAEFSRNNSQTDTPEFKKWFGDWQISAANDRVNSQIEQWASGELKSAEVMQIGNPSDVLRQFGVPDLPIHLTQSILTKAVNKKHEVDAPDLRDIVLNVQAPIAVFKSKAGADRLVIVTEARHADGNIVVALELEATRDGIEINDIRSIHPKRDESVAGWLAGGLLMGYEKSKGRNWLENSAASNSQQPQVKAALDNASVYDASHVRNSSKVVDSDGKPLTVYHGTFNDFSVFDKSRLGENTDNNASSRGYAETAHVGFWFNSRPMSSSSAGYVVDMPVYLSIQNPYREMSLDRLAQGLEQDDASEYRDNLIAQGYDGIVLSDEEFGGTSYIAFRPEQIKSAVGNNGQFDPDNPNIAMSRGSGAGMPQEDVPPGGMTMAAVQRALAPALAKLRNVQSVRIVQDQFEIPELAEVAERFAINPTIADSDVLADFFVNPVEGAYLDGTVYVAAGSLANEQHALKVLRHEVAHMSIEAMLETVQPGLYQKLINQVKLLDAGGNKYIRKLAGIIDRRQPGLDKNARASEILALIAERGDDTKEMTPVVRSLIQRLMDGIKAFYKLVFDEALSDRDVRDVVAASMRYAEGDNSISVFAGGANLEFSRDGEAIKFSRPNLTTINGKAPRDGWFASTKATENGKPMVLYRGASTSLREQHFKDDAFGKNSGHLSSSLGVWFTTSPDEAGRYGRAEKFAIDMRNPRVIKVEDLPSFEDAKDVIKFRENIRKQGHDGIVIDARHLGGQRHFIAFTPEQVIASENRAMFSRAGVVNESNPEISKYADLNRKFREEHITLLDKSKKWLKRQLAPGGLLPKSVFDEKIRRDSEFKVIEFDVNNLVGQLERAVANDYKLSAGDLDTKTQVLLSEVMAGKIGDVPEATKVALIGMRQYIDGLSMQYLDGMAQQIDDMVKSAEASGDQRLIAEAIERSALYEVIMGNVGQYVHRSYRAFDDANWARTVPDETLDAAREYLIARNLESMPQAAAETRAEVVLNEILKNGTAYDNMEAFIRESKLGAKDLSVLKTRKQIAPQIRALLGEYTDPRINFAKSATKMGRLIWNQKFLEKVREVGMGNFLFTDDTKPPEATAKIAADKSEVYAPLNGLWTFPETDQAFKDALGKEQMADWFRKVVQINGMVKYGKTVLSPTTAARNWMSAFFFTVANGHFDLRHMKKSVDGLKEYFTHNGEAGKLAYLRELKQLGVVYDTPYAGEMMRLLADSNLSDSLMLSNGKLKIKHAADMATKFYQFGDDFWKIIGFENEKRMWMDTGMPEQAAKEKAAERIRNTYPTYSMVGKGIQQLRRFPLLGTFVSFPAEIIRTSINMVRYLAEDYKDPKTRPLAMRRAAGMAIASSFAYAAQALSMAMLGYDDDDEEAVRLMAAPWQRNSSLLFTGRDENGNIRFLDLSFLDPYNYWKRPIIAVTRGQPFDEALRDVMAETLKPFFGVDILAGTIFEILANKKDSGAPVYRGHDDAISQLGDITNHLRKSVQPGIISNMERTWKAIDGETTPSGKKYDINDEAAAWVGFRVSTLDAKVALYYRSFDFKDAKSEADKQMRDLIRKPKGVDSEDLREAYDMTNKLRARAYQQMSQLVTAGKRSGMTNAEIYRTLKNSGITNADILSIRVGRVPNYRNNPQSMREQIMKARTTFGPEVAAEIRRRYQVVATYD